MKHTYLSLATTILMALPHASAQDNGLAPEVVDLNAEDVSYELEKELSYLKRAFISAEPKQKQDGIPTGVLGKDGGDAQAILEYAKSLAQPSDDPKTGKIDSLLISYQGKLLLEAYYRRGRANYPHYQMSITKSYTAMALGRAIQLGHLSMEDLHKPAIDFLTELDRDQLVEGADQITLHHAMQMGSGIRMPKDKIEQLRRKPKELLGQGQMQAYLANSEPIPPFPREFKYQSADTALTMQVIEAVVPGSARDFIDKEMWGQMGVTNYRWQDDTSGYPKAAAGSSVRSRDMLKMGLLVLDGGKWQGKQLIPEEYVKIATSPLRHSYGENSYGYFWWTRDTTIAGKKWHTIQGRGAGGQFIYMIPELDLVAVVTAHNKGMGNMLYQLPEKLIPAFAKKEQKTVAQKKPGKILFLLSGQSNMQGLKHEQTFQPRVYEAYGKDNVAIVKEAIGGRPIRMWVHDWKAAEDWTIDPNIPNTKAPLAEENGKLYHSMMAKVEDTLNGEKPRAVAFCWMQGERDSRERHSAVYERSLKTLFQQLRSDFDGVPIVFVIGKISDFGKDNQEPFYPEWEEIRAAQEQVAKDTDHCAIILTDDLNTGDSPPHWKTGEIRQYVDDLHMTAEGYRILGTRFAEEAIKLLGEVDS